MVEEDMELDRGFQKAKDKIVEDIIPNEVKAIAKSPIGKAALIGAGATMLPGIGGAISSGLGSLGTMAGQGLTNIGLGSVANTLGSLGSKALTGLGTVRGGLTDLVNKIPGLNIPGDSDAINEELQRVVGGREWDPNDPMAPVIPGVNTLPELSPFRKALATVLPGGDPGLLKVVV